MTTVEKVNEDIKELEKRIKEIETKLGYENGINLLTPLYNEKAQLRSQLTILLGQPGNDFVTRALGT